MGSGISSGNAARFCDSSSDRKFIVLHAAEPASARAPAAGGLQKVVRKSCGVEGPQRERLGAQAPAPPAPPVLDFPLPVQPPAPHPSFPSLRSRTAIGPPPPRRRLRDCLPCRGNSPLSLTGAGWDDARGRARRPPY